jgi:hypothetical protein
MDVVSNCPLPVAGRVWASVRGSLTLTIACKATYVLLPGLSQLAPEQEPINEDDNHWDDDPARSLCAPSDLAPYKPTGDVVLVGYAFAPSRVPVPSFHVRLIVGEIDKSIEVFGDRAWSPDGALSEPTRILRVPLRYERAGGGPGTWNPVGIRADAPDMYGRLLVPNLIPPGKLPAQRGEFVEPIGFGPIAPTWPTRAEKLGPYASVWDHKNWHERSLPEGFDFSFFNVAPPDQRLSEIRRNERLVLENLHPEHPRLVTSLPDLQPRAMAERAAGRRDEIPLVGDSMWIDTERGLCTVVWRGRIGLTHPQEAGRVTVILDDSQRPARPAEPAGGTQPSPPPKRRSANTLDLTDPAILALLSTQKEPPRGAMPFLQSGPAEAPAPPAPTAPSSARAGLPFAAAEAPPSVQAPAQPPAQPPAPPPPAIAPPPLVRPMMHEGTAPPTSSPPPSSPWASAAMATPEPPAKISIGQHGVAESSFPPPAAARDVPPSSKAAPNPAPSAVAPPQSTGRLSAVSASDAAALAASQAAPSSVETASSPPAGRPRTQLRSSPADPYVDLLWFDKTAPKRVRAQATFAAELRDEGGGGAWLTLEDTQQPKQELKDRRDVVRVLRRVPPVDADGVLRALASSIDEEGALSPPLVVVSGEIQLFFHEVHTLKATIAVASPLGGADKRLKETLDAANDLVQSDWKCTALAAEGMTSRLREAFVQANRTLPSNFLDQNVERVLLEQRGYQKRMILGEKRIRSAILPEGSQAPIPCYLPEELEAKLPLFQRFRAAIIAEARGQQDQYETSALALVTLAFARVLAMPTGR